MALSKRINIDQPLTGTLLNKMKDVLEGIWGTELQRIDEIEIARCWDGSKFSWRIHISGTKVVTETELKAGEIVSKE